MPRLRCPRCAFVVEAAPGARPVCPSCGFGSAAASAPAAPPAPPATAAPPPPAMPPAPAGASAPRSRRGRALAGVLAGLLVLAGAAAAGWFLLRGGGEAAELSQDEAESRLAAALASMPGTLSGDPPSDELRRVVLEAEPAERAPAGPQDLFGSMGEMTMGVEYGRGGAVRFELHMQSGAVTVAFSLVCTPERMFMMAGGEVYGSRPAVDPDPEGCRDADELAGAGMLFGGGGDGADGTGLGDTPFSPLEQLEAEDADVRTHADGTVTATLEQDSATVVVELDRHGRLSSVRAEEGAEGTFSLTYDYGPRSAIAVPADFQLLPATVETDEADDGAVRTWTVVDSPQEPALGELEARVQEWGFGFGDGQEALAAFPLREGPQAQGNFSFRFRDADGDGRLSAGDSWSLEDLSAAEEEPEGADCGEDEEFCFDFGEDFSFLPEHDVVLYDLEADGPVNSTPMEAPGPAAGVLAVAVLALAVALRRRLA